MMGEIMWYSSLSNVTASAQAAILYNECENGIDKISATSPRNQWIHSDHLCIHIRVRDHDSKSYSQTGIWWSNGIGNEE